MPRRSILSAAERESLLALRTQDGDPSLRSAKGTVAEVSDEALLSYSKALHFKLCHQAHFAQGITIIKC
jgi:phage baseplate assembly protein gpV